MPGHHMLRPTHTHTGQRTQMPACGTTCADSPGDAVSGVVALNVVQQFQCNAVLLRVEGYEATRWEERNERREYDNNRKEWVSHIDNHVHTGRR